MPAGFDLLLPAAAIGVLALIVAFYCRQGSTRRSDPAVSVLILAQNQESVIEGLIRETWRLSARTGFHHLDLVAVDEGSTDATPRILKKLGRDLPALKTAHWRPGETPGQSAMELGFFLCDHGTVLLLRLRDPRQARIFPQVLARFLQSGRCWEEEFIRQAGG